MRKAIDRLANGLLTLLALGLLAMVLVSFFNVISRYVFNNALLWAHEVAVFGMIAITWLGAIVCTWRNTEIRMDIIANSFPGAWQKPLLILLQLVSAVLLGWLSWLSLDYVARLKRFSMKSDAALIPTWTIHSVIFLSLGVMAVIAVFRLATAVFGRKTNKKVLTQEDFHE